MISMQDKPSSLRCEAKAVAAKYLIRESRKPCKIWTSCPDSWQCCKPPRLIPNQDNKTCEVLKGKGVELWQNTL
jgi:hypothetical protein